MSNTARQVPLRPAGDPAGPLPGRGTAVLGYLAIAGIGLSILIMIGASLIRQQWMFPHVVMPSVGPPWELPPVRIAPGVVIVALWLSALLGGLGVVAGLLAASRGVRPPMRLIAVAAIIAIAALTVLPPAGSSDALDYAAYGRLLVLGHNPYVTTPHYLRVLHDAFAISVPRKWEHQVSLYGPFATLEQFLAARLGGDSPARIVFWLKLWNSIAFGAVALVLDRLLRSDPARRLRAHLLWTLNPLLLWDLIAAGHVDVLAAAAGLIGLLAIGVQTRAVLGVVQDQPARPSLGRAMIAGALVGVAGDIKINYLLFGFGLAWALRRSPAAMITAADGALAVLVPTYAWLGTPALRALLARRSASSADNIYQLFTRASGHPGAHPPDVTVVAVALFAVLAVLLLWRLPAGDRLRPALRPALALSVAWLFIWPYQLPWYEAIIICVLVLAPASRLDWLVLLRLTAATISNMPGNPWAPPGHVLAVLDRVVIYRVAPVALLAAVVGVVLLAVSGRWGLRLPPRGHPPLQPPRRPPSARISSSASSATPART
jgi:hypothetical protein